MIRSFGFAGAYIVSHVCATAWGSGNRAPSEAATFENNVAATRDKKRRDACANREPA